MRTGVFLLAHRVADVVAQLGLVVHDLHGAAAQHVARAHEDRVANGARLADGLLGLEGDAGLGLRDAQRAHQGVELLAVLRQVDGAGLRAPDLGGQVGARLEGGLEGEREVDGGLAAELHEDAVGALALDAVHDVLEREGLEVEAVAGVEVGGDRLRVVVEEDGLHALLLDGPGGVDAAVVELDALPNADGPGAEHEDALLGGPR